jgi:hypothetical protein
VQLFLNLYRTRIGTVLPLVLAAMLVATPGRPSWPVERPIWIECRGQTEALLGWDLDGRRLDALRPSEPAQMADAVWFGLFADGTVARLIAVEHEPPTAAYKWPVLARDGAELLVLVHVQDNPGATLYRVNFDKLRVLEVSLGSVVDVASARVLKCVRG